ATDTGADVRTCPEYPGHRSVTQRRGELSVTISPKGTTDLTWVWGWQLLISPKALDLLTKHRVTGFEALPAKCSHRKPSAAPVPELYELVVKCALPARAAGVTVVAACPACVYKRYAIADPTRLIDVATWDGSDIFFVWPLPAFRFVSERLARILRQER